MRHANMDEYSSVGPCAYSMCMMIELRSTPAQLSSAGYVRAWSAAMQRPPPRCAVAATFSLRLAALVPDQIFWQFLTISPTSQHI